VSRVWSAPTGANEETHLDVIVHV